MNDRSGGKEPKAAQLVTFDAILPTTMAFRAEEAGVKRVALDHLTLFILSILAGAFIAFGAIFATTVMAGNVTSFNNCQRQDLAGFYPGGPSRHPV